jgi:3-oxoacyl-(acyl-carrier-protein) synthase III
MSMTETPPPAPGPAGGSRLLSVAGYRPERVVDNAELCRSVDSSPEWIETRSGIRERRFAGPHETLLSMGTSAARSALERAGIGADELELVVVASMSNLVQTPPLAVALAHAIGAGRAGAFDVSAACAGFCHALGTASAAVRSGEAGYALVVGTERMTDLVEPADRTVSVLFADGAGAVVIGADERARIGPTVRGADGAHSEALRMDAAWAGQGARPWMRMDGRRVFRWAMDEAAPRALRAIRAAGLEPGDLDAFVPHQANARMIDLLAERLGLRPDVYVARDVVRSGNTSAASIPLALDAALRGKAVDSGATALLFGFGAGLNCAGQVVVLP